MSTVSWWVVVDLNLRWSSISTAPGTNEDNTLRSESKAGWPARTGAQETAVNINGTEYLGYGGPYGTRAEADKALPALMKNAPKGNTLHLPAPPSNPLDVLTGFLSDITSSNLWIRAVKIIAGGAILLIGLAKITGIDQGIAGKAIKAAPLL